ncbi:MAG TPA: C25 family cysteine peptidase [Thermodesulfobacteriota bacterium]|nr:hypothetical protein [Deltaproteobacteria bacterium]HNR12428.1 C25 family cysteine peptidase [Thermodesulfobacteriota bacterium]HNU70456.1 C25 family cysteine peptidase [Thermodesulfobacteriota bacterium]HQO77062.1 C25 family cysteine peptidase [Thermodesulfobacteriota bacterium]
MTEETKGRCLIAACLISSLMFLASASFGAVYTQIYQFESPTIIRTDDGTCIIEISDTWQNDVLPNRPILPARIAKLFIPADEVVVDTIVTTSPPEAVEGVYTVQRSVPASPFSLFSSVNTYPAAAPAHSFRTFPPQHFIMRGSQYLCGAQIVRVELTPIVYNQEDSTLQYYRQMTVKLVTESRETPSAIMPLSSMKTDYQRILSAVDNPHDMLSAHLDSRMKSEAPVRHVIITTRKMAPAFQTLSDFRATPLGGGFVTSVVAIEDIEAAYRGSDLAEKVRNFIRDSYLNDNTRFVIMGGDCDRLPAEQTIPTRGAYATYYSWAENAFWEDQYIPCDLYFGCLDGTWNADNDHLWGEPADGIDGGDIDWYPEVFVGRIAADNLMEASNHIEKIIAFETAPHPSGQTLLVGEMLYFRTFSGDRLDWIYTFMSDMPKTVLYDLDHPPFYRWPKSDVITLLDTNDYSWVNHCGHSGYSVSMKLLNTDVAMLTNSNPFFLYSQGCFCGSIDSRKSSDSEDYAASDCFGEAITCGYGDRGAAAFIGNSRYGWYEKYNRIRAASNLAHEFFVRAVFEQGMTQLGVANQMSKLDLPLSNELYRWIAFQTNLLGDPAAVLSVP